jgi:hypothetical protein
MNYEKSYLDKPLAKEDASRVLDLMKKPHLSKEELTTVFHHVSTIEQKLLNFEENDKYVLTECVIFMEHLYRVAIQIYEIEEKTYNDDPYVKQLWLTNKHKSESNVRTLFTLYLNMARGTLSLGGVGFDKVITNRFEYVYPTGGGEGDRRGFWDKIPFIGGGGK